MHRGRQRVNTRHACIREVSVKQAGSLRHGRADGRYPLCAMRLGKRPAISVPGRTGTVLPLPLQRLARRQVDPSWPPDSAGTAHLGSAGRPASSGAQCARSRLLWFVRSEFYTVGCDLVRRSARPSRAGGVGRANPWVGCSGGAARGDSWHRNFKRLLRRDATIGQLEVTL
jgi:hypothetical protein